jgi:Small protein A (tmRNA-binding)
MKLFFFIILSIIITSCSTNKVVKNHGIAGLENKTTEIIVSKTNKNDALNILGPPSTKSSFDDNVWLYLERKKVNQSIFKLGKRRIEKNNVLVLKFNSLGILENKNFYDIEKMNDIKFSEEITESGYSKNSFVYSFLTSLREKINSPVKNRVNKRSKKQ